MPTTLVVYNPAAGRRRRRREEQVAAVVSKLQRSGITALTAATVAVGQDPASIFADKPAFDRVLVCGGDGSVNQVLQGLVASGRDVALGIVPFGSGNVLAKELGIRAAGRLLEEPSSCPARKASIACIERMDTQERRYWLAAAGVGADARVICGVSPAAKARLGIGAYYAEAVRQLFSSPLPQFEVEFEDRATGKTRREQAAQVIAEKVGYFGSFLEDKCNGPLAWDEMRVILFKTQARATLFRYGLNQLGWRTLGRRGALDPRKVEVVRASEIRCLPSGAESSVTKSLAEVDGELFGEVPVRLYVTDRKIDLLCPKQ